MLYGIIRKLTSTIRDNDTCLTIELMDATSLRQIEKYSIVYRSNNHAKQKMEILRWIRELLWVTSYGIQCRKRAYYRYRLCWHATYGSDFMHTMDALYCLLHCTLYRQGNVLGISPCEI